MPTTADNKASERKEVTILLSPQAKQEGERARGQERPSPPSRS